MEMEVKWVKGGCVLEGYEGFVGVVIGCGVAGGWQRVVQNIVLEVVVERQLGL
jgi:hypothetical protein